MRDQLVEHLRAVLGPDSGQASVTFLGVAPIEVLRFGPGSDGGWRYATVGMSSTPMSDPRDFDATSGPRAELLLSLARQHDDVVRALATVAASPAIEGIVLRPGSTFDLGQPLWPGSRFTGVLVGKPGGLVADVDPGDGGQVIEVLPLLLMTPSESAFARVKGSAQLQARWLDQRLDLRADDRPEVDLAG